LEAIVHRTANVEKAPINSNLNTTEHSDTPLIDLVRKIKIFEGRISKLYEERKEAIDAGFTIDSKEVVDIDSDITKFKARKRELTEEEDNIMGLF
jgi:hypothetical protein